MQFNYFDTLLRAQKAYARLLEPLCREFDLTRNELDVLLFLANNPGQDRAVDVVNGRGMSKSHVSLSVTNLEERGLLIRREDPADRRTVHLLLTDRALRIAEAGREAQRGFFTRIHAGVTPEETQAMYSFSQKVSDNIKKLEAES